MPALVLIRRHPLGATHLGMLGLYVSLRRICWEQRADHGNNYASIARRKLAEIVGVTPRWITYTGKALEECGVVRREEQQSQSGANTTMKWWLLNLSNDDVLAAIQRDRESPASQDALPEGARDRGQAVATPGERKPHDPGKESGTPAEKTAHTPGKEDDTAAATLPAGSGVNRAGDPAATIASYARARDAQPENSHTEDSPSSELVEGQDAEGRGTALETLVSEDECIAICERFARWLVADTSPAVLDSPGSWRPARAAWIAAARKLLELGYDAARVDEILHDLNDDYKFGDRLHALPELPPQIHQLAKRAAHRRRARASQAGGNGGDGFDVAFAEVKALAGRYGRDGLAQASERLEQLDAHQRRFVEAAGWRRICDATSFDESALRRVWREAADGGGSSE